MTNDITYCDLIKEGLKRFAFLYRSLSEEDREYELMRINEFANLISNDLIRDTHKKLIKSRLAKITAQE